MPFILDTVDQPFNTDLPVWNVIVLYAWHRSMVPDKVQLWWSEKAFVDAAESALLTEMNLSEKVPGSACG